MSEKIGIVGYGAYVPRYRIKAAEIARAWGLDPVGYPKGLAIEEKAVAGPDEDTITLSVAAARRALCRAGMDGALIGALYIGSESHPYAVKPSGTIVAEAIGAAPWLHLADIEFACKAGTEAMQICASLVAAGRADCALAIGADTAQSAPGDPLEFATSAGAAAFIFGKKNLLATLDETVSHVTDTPDFWRRSGQRFPRHGGRFTGEPAYFHQILSTAKKAFEKTGLKPSDFRYVVFHEPNGKFPVRVGKMLGFTPDQLRAGLLSPRIGNAYSAASPLGLCAVLDEASPGDRVLMVSYGSGAGSDAFVLTATDGIEAGRGRTPTVRAILDAPTVELDYTQYARYRKKIIQEG